MCFENYITIDNSTPSKSGLYFTDLPGLNLAVLQGLKKQEQADYQTLFSNLYKNAQINLKVDLQRKLSNRFHIDKKLITRETSEFRNEVNDGSELAGVKISVSLPKYARVHILSIGVRSAQEYLSPEAQFFIHKDDADGELLSTVSAELQEGRNTVDVYQEFEESELFIGYDPSELELYQTRNKYYPLDKSIRGVTQDIACSFPCIYGDEGSVYQINSGGLNVKFLVYCSMEKFLCDNLPLFQYALWHRLGIETTKEKIVTDRVNRFSVLTKDEATDLMAVYSEDYNAALDAATMNIKMQEDPICFMCKSTIKSKTNLP